jgi:hypothetical protein
MGPSLYFSSLREINSLWQMCWTFKKRIMLGLSCPYCRIDRVCLGGGNLVQFWREFQLFFPNLTSLSTIIMCAWSESHHVVFLEWVSSSTMCMYVFATYWHCLLVSMMLGRQSSHLWKPAPPLKRSWNTHGFSLVWSKQKVFKKQDLVSHTCTCKSEK